MKIPIKKTALYYASIIYLIILNTQFLLIEPTFISPVKVVCMAMAPLLFFATGLVISKALIWGIVYWLLCFIPAYLQGGMRFSTLGYLGMFIITFIVYYTAIHQGVFTLKTFKTILCTLILAYAICLLLQQLFSLVGISSFLPINLTSGFRGMEKFRSLSLEPSHSAVILTFAFLCYMRCLKLELGRKPTIKELFLKPHRWISIGFLWAMLTMGSGSAYLGLMTLMLYFVRGKNVIIVASGLIILLSISPYLDNKQLNRATRTFKATLTGNTDRIVEVDGSGASRIVPLLNTFTKLDLSDPQTWFGHGTLSKNDKYHNAWKNLKESDWFILPVARQYGIIAFAASILLVFSCCIKKIFSLETLLWFTLGMATLGNVYFHWGTILMLASVRYFQERKINEY